MQNQELKWLLSLWNTIEPYSVFPQYIDFLIGKKTQVLHSRTRPSNLLIFLEKGVYLFVCLFILKLILLLMESETYEFVKKAILCAHLTVLFSNSLHNEPSLSRKFPALLQRIRWRSGRYARCVFCVNCDMRTSSPCWTCSPPKARMWVPPYVRSEAWNLDEMGLIL